MHRGFIVLWRKIQDSSIYKDPEGCHLAMHLLLEANHAPKKMIFNGELVVVERGQLLTGRNTLSLDSGISPSTVWRKLQLLKNIEFLDIKSNNRFSIITIRNYSLYQNCELGDEQQLEQQTDSQRTASGQPADSQAAQTTIQPLRTTKNNDILRKEKSPVKAVQDFYYAEYARAYNVPYVAEFGKDGAIFKTLVKMLGEAKVKELILVFFSIKDDFMDEAGHTTGVFRSQINKLLTSKQAQIARVERQMSQ